MSLTVEHLLHEFNQVIIREPILGPILEVAECPDQLRQDTTTELYPTRAFERLSTKFNQFGDISLAQ